MREYQGHHLNMSSLDGMARCQCNGWQWHIGPDLGEAYAGHVRQEQEREAQLIAFLDSRPVGPSRLAKAGQLAVTLLVFTVIMFTVLHFIG
jgi:hypothetical protein